MCVCISILMRLFVCVFHGRVTEQKETGVWECQEKIWLVCTLLKTLWAGTMGCPDVKRYDLDCVTT